jgi:hypothetical protein
VAGRFPARIKCGRSLVIIFSCYAPGKVSLGKSLPGPGAFVQADWFGWLPDAKCQTFNVYAEECEACYMMLSVSLDEAIGLRDSGSLAKSFQVISVIPALCGRLASLLQGMLRSLEEHTKRYRVRPSVAPLNPADFQGPRGKRSALKNCLLNWILRSQPAQFLSKISTLRKMVTSLGNDFRNAAKELASHGAAVEPAPLWATLDAGHFDLNTCLRESMVLLKCFLRALPDDQLVRFQETVRTQTTQLKPHQSHRAFIIIIVGFLLLRGCTVLLEPDALSLLGVFANS